MGYVNVNVDINLDDIDTDDLIDEFCIRLERKGRVNDDEKQQLREALGTPTFENIEIKTLDDTMKYDHLSKVFTKYTLTQIETLLP